MCVSLSSNQAIKSSFGRPVVRSSFVVLTHSLDWNDIGMGSDSGMATRSTIIEEWPAINGNTALRPSGAAGAAGGQRPKVD